MQCAGINQGAAGIAAGSLLPGPLLTAAGTTGTFAITPPQY
jgi:hypothetical protein